MSNLQKAQTSGEVPDKTTRTEAIDILNHAINNNIMFNLPPLKTTHPETDA